MEPHEVPAPEPYVPDDEPLPDLIPTAGRLDGRDLAGVITGGALLLIVGALIAWALVLR